jgi:hypothetical protein
MLYDSNVQVLRFGPVRVSSTQFDQKINPKTSLYYEPQWKNRPVAGASSGCGQIETVSICLSAQIKRQNYEGRIKKSIAGKNARGRYIGPESFRGSARLIFLPSIRWASHRVAVCRSDLEEDLVKVSRPISEKLKVI